MAVVPASVACHDVHDRHAILQVLHVVAKLRQIVVVHGHINPPVCNTLQGMRVSFLYDRT